MAGICSRCDGVNRVHSTSLGCNDKWYVPSIIIMQLLKGREKGRCQHLSWLPLVCVPIIIENKWMICFWHVAAVVAPTSFLRLTSSSLSFAAWQQHAPHESVKKKSHLLALTSSICNNNRPILLLFIMLNLRELCCLVLFSVCRLVSALCSVISLPHCHFPDPSDNWFKYFWHLWEIIANINHGPAAVAPAHNNLHTRLGYETREL